MITFLNDLRYAFRMLLRAPGFTAVAVITLALGIGANSAMFSVINGVLLRPLPYAEPDRLMALYASTPQFGQSSISYKNYVDWRNRNHTFENLAAVRSADFTLTEKGTGAERLRVKMVSFEYFSVLRAQPIVGRTFTADDDVPGHMPTVVITKSLWQRRHASSPAVLGQKLELNGAPYTVIGVVEDVGVDRRSAAFVPVGTWSKMFLEDRNISAGMYAIGRLKPGVSREAAQADMSLVAKALATEFPDSNHNQGITVMSLAEDTVGIVRKPLLLLLGAVALVLLIACANIANLLLARSTERRREFAVRAALGASSSRMVRQLLTEGLLLSVVGGGLGLLIAFWGIKPFVAAVPGSLPRVNEITVGPEVLAFTTLVSLFATAVFGLMPAWQSSRLDVNETLKEAGRGNIGGRSRAQRVFVVAEIALALVLTTGAGLMVRTLSQLWKVNPGFDPTNVLTFSVSGSTGDDTNAAAVRAHYDRLLSALKTLPGIEGASLLWGSLPMNGDSEIPFWLQGQPKPANQDQMNWALFYYVAPDYQRIMRLPILKGRYVSEQDSPAATHTVVIDELLATKVFGNVDPVGRVINFQWLGPAQVIGVVGHVKHWGLDTDATAKVQYQVYFPYQQFPEAFSKMIAEGSTVLLRSPIDTAALITAARKKVAETNPNLAVYDTQTLPDIVADSMSQRRFIRLLLVAFAALALVLASMGIYGVISYTVSRSVHEIGIRIALGAASHDVLHHVLGGALRMTALGIGIGLAIGLAATRAMSGLLFGVASTDPATFAVVAVLLAAVALLAAFLPARRATRVDPMVALRDE